MKERSKDFANQRDVLMKMVARKPMLHVTSKDLPAVESWEVGEKYKIYGEVELKGLRKTDSGVEGELEIVSLSDEESEPEEDD